MRVTIDPKVKRLREKADAAFSDRKWQKALDLYLESQEKGSYDPRIGQRIAELCKRVGEIEKSVSHYKRLVEHYSHEGFWAKAIAVSKMILDIDPTDLKVRNQLSVLYSAQGTVMKGPELTPPPPREALSLSGAEPRTMDAPPEEPGDSAVFGATISIPEGEPYSAAGNLLELGTPLREARVPLFSEMEPEELAAVLEHLAVRRFPEGALVCEEGDTGDAMFIISEGSVEVSVKESDGTRLVLARLRGGDFFGEYSLLTESSRNATVTAKTELELLEITRRDFEAIGERHPRISGVLEEYLKQRVLDTIFARSPVFRALTPAERRELTQRVTTRTVEMDREVMTEGTDGDEMFFVKSGIVTASTSQGGGRIILGELGPGDYFGEIAMLTGKPRTATIRTRTGCEFFCLKRADAAPVLRNNREILDLLRTKIRERVAGTRQTLESYKESRLTLV